MIYRSPYPDLHIPDLALPTFILQEADARGDKPALIDGPSGRTLTYAQLAAAVRRAAAGLAARGFHKGDVLAIYSPNVPEYAVAFHGAARAGGIVTTANPLYTADELASQLQDAGARFLLTVPVFLEKALQAADAAGIKEVFVFGEAEGATPFAALLQTDAAPPDIAFDPAEDLVALPYSSGTTGLPKGVMLTHRNLVANVLQTIAVEQTKPDVVMIGILPFFHIYGMTVIMNMALYAGATVVTMPRFDLEQFLTLLQQHNVTHAPIVPPIILALAKHPLVDAFDLTSLQAILSGAAPLGADLAQACSARLGCIVKQGYGLTETSPVTHVSPYDDAWTKTDSVGDPVPETECMIVDVATREPLGPGETGELWMRGPQIMKGYLNRPEATAHMIDEDGWLHTGDLARVDEDGHFYVVDRVKELIKYKGFQVAPAELESLLLSHPAVADAAVIPVPDEEAGEVPKGFVVLKPHVQADSDALITYVAEQVAPHKKIRLLEIVDQIPKSASGKILRRQLVQRERERIAAQ